MTTRHSRFLLVALALTLCACEHTGATLGENMPGQDTHLSSGSIAVDPITEDIFVLETVDRTEESGRRVTERYVVRVEASHDSPQRVIDVNDGRDVRMMFPSTGILLMVETDRGEALRLYDRHTMQLLRERYVDAHYWGTRLSASGRHLLVADSGGDQSALHLLDTET